MQTNLNTDFTYERRPVVGYEGLYEVSNMGEVFSLNYRGVKGAERKLSLSKHPEGYLSIGLYQDGLRRLVLVHRLVLEAFVPNPDNKPCCDHIDTDRTNNCVTNLQWVTRKENQNNPLTRKKMEKAKKGKTRPPFNQYTHTFQNKNTGKIFTGLPSQLCTKYNLNRGNISKLVRGLIKSSENWVLLTQPTTTSV